VSARSAAKDTGGVLCRRRVRPHSRAHLASWQWQRWPWLFYLLCPGGIGI